jgi:hypothetical protein
MQGKHVPGCVRFRADGRTVNATADGRKSLAYYFPFAGVVRLRPPVPLRLRQGATRQATAASLPVDLSTRGETIGLALTSSQDAAEVSAAPPRLPTRARTIQSTELSTGGER